MTVFLWSLGKGQSFASLTEEFRIGESTFNTFDKKFLKWFHMTYWQEYRLQNGP
jgi:hypothetical protein